MPLSANGSRNLCRLRPMVPMISAPLAANGPNRKCLLFPAVSTQAANGIALGRKPLLIFCHNISLDIFTVMKIISMIFQDPAGFLHLLQ